MLGEAERRNFKSAAKISVTLKNLSVVPERDICLSAPKIMHVWKKNQGVRIGRKGFILGLRKIFNHDISKDKNMKIKYTIEEQAFNNFLK